MKQLLAPVLALCLAACPALAAPLEPVSSFDLQTPSYLLMEASTGQVILEQNADETRPVASVTKLMTLLLVLEALDAGTVSLTDSIVCSSNAAGMGGSQALLDAGSAYPLEDLLKSTIVASANDSAVALAEHLAGTEANFVERMNRRAAELGLTQTVYQNCTGLPAEGQHTTARDVANLSRQIGRHPLYYQYSTLWMDTLEHPGGRTTDLVNTNRLVRFFEGCDGYKTGSTDEARYCISATAQKDGMRLIAVLLGTPASQTRFNEARKLLEYGFSTYRLLPVCQAGDALGEEVSVARGSADTVGAAAGAGMTLLIRRGEESSVSLQVALPEEVQAPVAKGDTLGELRVLKDGNLIATLHATATEDVGLPGVLEALLRIVQAWRR